MPRRRAAVRASGGGGGGGAEAPPVKLDADGDAAVLGVLAKCESPPSLFVNPALGFKIIWALKTLAARARERVRAARAAGDKKKKRGGKKRKPEAGAILLRSRLKFLGLRMKTIDGDGNCQFRACSDQLYGTQEHHEMVRSSAVDFMRAHDSDFSCFCVEEGAFESYLSLMLKGRRGKPTWGDELTLRAICNCLGATIHVLTSAPGTFYLKYVPERQKTTKQLFLAYISPSHYNAFELAPGATNGGKAAAPKAAGRKRGAGKGGGGGKGAAKRARR